MEITSGDIFLENVYGFKKMISLEILQIPNSHPYAKLEYRLDAGLDISKIKSSL